MVLFPKGTVHRDLFNFATTLRCSGLLCWERGGGRLNEYSKHYVLTSALA
jgi:hypothetical protein